MRVNLIITKYYIPKWQEQHLSKLKDINELELELECWYTI